MFRAVPPTISAVAITGCLLALACEESAPAEPAVQLDFGGLLDGGFETAPQVPTASAASSGAPAGSEAEANSDAKQAAPESDTAAPFVAGSDTDPQPPPETTETDSPKEADQTDDARPGLLPVAEVSDGSPRLAATAVATIVYNRPHKSSKRLGYIRLGGVVERSAEPARGSGCKGKWYEVKPLGFVCTEEATIDINDALVRATRVRPDVSKPLPYHYGFVRATAPQYLRIPTHAEQVKSEFKLDEHLQWYHEHFDEVQRVTLGANDIPLDESGIARLGMPHPRGFKLSTQMTPLELLGAQEPSGKIPFWLDGKRHIPNVADFKVPEYAVFADRVRRKTGLSFVDAFVTEDEGVRRPFAVTVDMRLIPTTKVKPDTGSPFHGVELQGDVKMPFAFVIKRDSNTWKLLKGKDEVKADAPVPRRSLVPVTGKARIKAGQRFYQTARMPTRWLKADEVAVVTPPPELPEEAKAGERWIDVSLRQQTLVLYEGTKPIYATLVSTGRDRLGDPENSLATPQGEFRIQSKHIAAAMDSEENSTVSGGTKVGRKVRLDPEARATRDRLLKADKDGTPLDDRDKRRLANIKKGRHPEYGVTMRRGSGGYELRDVPWIQYFAAGYALHGAYWHDVFGIPRSHGCINLAPIDARIVFNFTQPAVPEGWHGFNVSDEFGQGTLVHIRE